MQVMEMRVMHRNGLFFTFRGVFAKERNRKIQTMDCWEKAFREFYFNTYAALHKYIRKMGVSEIEAEDIAQEAYCKAYGCRDKLRCHPNPTGWLYKTAYYIQRNQSRRMENHTISLELVREADLKSVIRCGYESVEFAILIKEVLSEKDRELIYKYYLEGYKGAEIAMQMGISEENFRVKMSRIRKKMRTGIGK